MDEHVGHQQHATDRVEREEPVAKETVVKETAADVEER